MKESSTQKSAISSIKSGLKHRPKANFYQVEDGVQLYLANGSQVSVAAICPRNRTLLVTTEEKKVVRVPRVGISPMSWPALDEFNRDSHKPIIKLKDGTPATVIAASPGKTRICVKYTKTVTRIIKKGDVHPSFYEKVDRLMKFK